MTVSDLSASNPAPIVARLRSALDRVAPESLKIEESFVIEIGPKRPGPNSKVGPKNVSPGEYPRWWIIVSREKLTVTDQIDRIPELALLKVYLDPTFFDQVINGTVTAEQLVDQGAIKLGGDTRILREASFVVQAIAAAVIS